MTERVIDGVIDFVPEAQNRAIGTLTLNRLVGPDAIREAVWSVARTLNVAINRQGRSGMIPVLFPRPVLDYERSGKNDVQVTVCVNGGNQEQAQQLYDALVKYVP